MTTEYRIEELETKLQELKQSLLKPTLESDKWYRDTTDKYALIIYNKNNNKCFGIGRGGIWTDSYNVDNTPIEDYELATDKEVEEALIKEAKKRGFKKGVKFKGLRDGDIEICEIRIESVCSGCLEFGTDYIFNYNNDGKWAEITEDVPEYTMDELSDKLGFTFKIKK